MEQKILLLTTLVGIRCNKKESRAIIVPGVKNTTEIRFSLQGAQKLETTPNLFCNQSQIRLPIKTKSKEVRGDNT